LTAGFCGFVDLLPQVALLRRVERNAGKDSPTKLIDTEQSGSPKFNELFLSAAALLHSER
jgi:hypothetical protein